MIWFARSLAAVRKIKISGKFFAVIIFGGLALPAFAVEGDAEAGKSKAATCMACHGPNGNSIVAMWPSIAGPGNKRLDQREAAYAD